MPRTSATPLKTKLLLVAASLSVAAAIAEITIAWSGLITPFPDHYVGEYDSRPSPNFVDDEQLGWKMRPGTRFNWFTSEYDIDIAANAQGFRGPDFDAAAEGRKIVLAGDSFTFGTGVEYPETFGALLESGLPGVAVHNLAMPAFGVDQMWLSIRHHALRYRPSLIVVGLVDADFKRSLTAFRGPPEARNKPVFKLVDGGLVLQTAADRPPAALHYLEHHSRLWTLARLAGRWLGYRVPFGKWWHVNRAILDAIRSDCEASTRVLFLYIPTQAWRSFPTLSGYMESTAADFIDLRAALGDPDGLYYPIDGHLNAAGHAAVAEELRRWIDSNMPELVPPTEAR